jgi:hypothetical protein
MAALARLSPIAIWNSRIDLRAAISEIESTKIRRKVEALVANILAAEGRHYNLVDRAGSTWKLREVTDVNLIKRSRNSPLLMRIRQNATGVHCSAAMNEGRIAVSRPQRGSL